MCSVRLPQRFKPSITENPRLWEEADTEAQVFKHSLPLSVAASHGRDNNFEKFSLDLVCPKGKNAMTVRFTDPVRWFFRVFH